MRSWRRHRVPFIEQGEHSECGLAAAAMILAAFGHPVTMDELRHRYGAPRGGLSLANIVTVLSGSGIRVRAVVGRPDFLLMDEPTSALDNDTERHVMTALLDSDNACIVVAHRLASIRDFDRIHVMDHGRIVESGTHDELLQAGGLYSRLYRQE